GAARRLSVTVLVVRSIALEERRKELQLLARVRRQARLGYGELRPKTDEVVVRVDVVPAGQRRDRQSAFARSGHRLAVDEGRAPGDALEHDRMWSVHPDEVIPAIGCGTDHEIVDVEGVACRLDETRPQRRVVAP